LDTTISPSKKEGATGNDIAATSFTQDMGNMYKGTKGYIIGAFGGGKK
jgi:hypothetical protein